MRLICLNVWGGKKFDALKEFMEKESPETDIFCFQEVLDFDGPKPSWKTGHVGLYGELKELLPGFDSSFAPMAISEMSGEPDKIPTGNAIFWKKALRRANGGNFFAYGSLGRKYRGEPHKVGLLQHESFETAAGPLTVANFHGIATWPKIDTADRLEQSNKIADFLAGVSGSKILCGDFNLFPNTESIAVFGKTMKNLTRELGIKTTRSRFALDKFKGDAVTDTTSDYAFVSPDIRVNSFSVPEAEISDHLPLVLDFSL